MRGLYAIADTQALAARGLPVVPFIEAVLAAKPAALQLRDKRGTARETLSLLRAIGPLAARAGVPLFANDRLDLALLARCDGVHVGQDDLPVALVRMVAKKAGQPVLVGLSTHAEAEIDAALEQEAPDYIAVGPVFATQSKDRPHAALGLDTLARLVGRIRVTKPGVPIVAIGGVTLENARDVGAIADSVAIIAGLAEVGSIEAVTERAMALDQRIRGKV